MGVVSTFFGILSFALAFGAAIPYVGAILKGKARPARSTRFLFLLLMIVILVVQKSEFTSWVLMFTVAELAKQTILAFLSIKHGMGGLDKLDIVCYVAFIISLPAYLLTQSAALSLTLFVLVDLIAFLPTIVKIWRDPASDSWVFFAIGGIGAGAASLLARSSNSYTEVVFPAYILIVNMFAIAPMLLHKNAIHKKYSQS